MTFPSVVTTNTSVDDTDTLNHTVSLPSGIVSGNLLIVPFCTDGDESVGFPAGWTEIFELAFGIVTLAVAYRKADGTEGATITVTTGTTEQSSHCSYHITGHEDPTTQAPEISVGGLDISANPDPDSLTPTGGAKDYLWLAIHGHDVNRTTDAFPTSYSNGISTQGANAAGTGIGCAERQLNASSENPGTFTISASQRWVAATMAVHPAPLLLGPGKDSEILLPSPRWDRSVRFY